MMAIRNLIHDLLHRDDGETLAFEVERPGDDPLSLRLVLPDNVRLIPVGKLVAAAREAPAWVHERNASLQEAAQASGTVVCGAICPAEDPTDVLATLTILHAENLEGPDFVVPEVAPGSDVIRQEVEHPSPHTTTVHRLCGFTPAPGAEKQPMLVQQWLTETKYGAMSIVFVTTHYGGDSPKMQTFFDRIVDSIRLGPPHGG